jgi:hypothetical protein
LSWLVYRGGESDGGYGIRSRGLGGRTSGTDDDRD